jgi:hypothetical protein
MLTSKLLQNVQINHWICVPYHPDGRINLWPSFNGPTQGKINQSINIQRIQQPRMEENNSITEQNIR